MPITSQDESVAPMAERLCAVIRQYTSVAVAFSGGVDSAVVAKAAKIALGDKAIAVTAVSPSLASAELQVARSEAEAIGIRHVEINTNEFERPDYRANAGNRCFFCKDTLYRFTKDRLSELGVHCIANGANTDDLGDHRPGMQAAADHHVRSPLIEAGFNKAEVRQLARFWNLTVADKPASPCLSSRIAYGVEVTPERVRQVELAEAYLRAAFSLTELRVRYEADDLARIEVPLSELSRLTNPPAVSALTAEFKRLGFRRITLDLEGFRSGNLNESLAFVPLTMDIQ